MDQINVLPGVFFLENSWYDILQTQEREFRLKVPK